MKKELYVFFLPRYSPHLNKAETYRRKMIGSAQLRESK
jgi:hypothetical protein